MSAARIPQEPDAVVIALRHLASQSQTASSSDAKLLELLQSALAYRTDVAWRGMWTLTLFDHIRFDPANRLMVMWGFSIR